MSKETVIIKTQYYENYNVGPDGFNTYGDKQPHWKPKGGMDFVIEMDADILLYCDNKEEVFQKMLDGHETVAERFEYRDYEVQWYKPHLLGSEDDFLQAMKSVASETKSPLSL